MRALARSAVFWGLTLAAGPAAADLTEVAVGFDVVNTNRSAVPCPSDGKPYLVTGHLVGPSSAFLGSADGERVVGLRNRNPCGHISSTVPTIRMDLARMSEIQIPVLLVFPGPDDPVISREGQEQEAGNYSGSDDVTTAWLDSGHFMELERCAPAFRALTAHWIHRRWGAGADIPAPAVEPNECVTELRVKAP